MSAIRPRATPLAAALALSLAATSSSFAQKKYDTGATDTEIKIGNIAPYSGPASAYGAITRTEEAYFRMINDKGGVNGRKINFISYDDAYSPPKAVEQTRKLVESDEVLLMFSPIGTASTSAIQKYLNTKKVPQLFAATGAAKWNDPKNFPWTMGWQPSYRSEGQIYAKYILKEHANAKIGVIYQNDDLGKDYLTGLKNGLGDKASMIVSEETYEISAPTIDSHIVKLKSHDPDVVMIFTTPKFGAQTIKKMSELNWKPVRIIGNASSTIATVLRPAGMEASTGIMSAHYSKDGIDPQWQHDEGIKRYTAFMDAYMPQSSKGDTNHTYGYGIAQTLVKTLEMAGDDLTRANIMKQAASLKDYRNDTVLPGILMNTSATDFAPIEQLSMQRFDGTKWVLFGDIISAR
jgi:branched-chain amino acid transport system substrate-binding protein